MAGKTYLTAITRNIRSAPAARLQKTGLIKGKVLDYGCGKGRDIQFYDNAVGYDPYYRPDLKVLKKKYDTVVCTYVANVLNYTERKDLYRVLHKLAKGDILITVRRNIKKEGFTNKGTYQETVYVDRETKASLLWENSNYATYQLGKNIL